MKLGLTKNNKLNDVTKAAICVLLCFVFGLQSFVFAAGEPELLADKKNKDNYILTNITNEQAKSIETIDSRIDELLDLYVELSYYELDRDQAIKAMLRKILLDYPDMAEYLGDALLTAFDDFGGYYPQTSVNQLFSNMEYYGYGIVFEAKKTVNGHGYGAVVEKALVDSPARFSLQIGDEIIKINDINVEDMGVNAVSDLLRFYNKATLTVRRGTEEKTFTINKAIVTVTASTFYYDKEKSTAIAKVTNFTDMGMIYDIYMFLQYLEENDYKNVIIDVRDNPGGDLVNLLYALDLFVTEKDVVLCSIIDRNGETIEEYLSSGSGFAFDKICVLTSGRSASASEIFALAMRELTGAVIIGEKTFGKGVGQHYEALKNGDVVAITSFEVVSPKGIKYHKKGVEPDIKISAEYINVKNTALGQLNFVSCRDIKEGAKNKAVLALNQRLSRIGYLAPEYVTDECTEKTITAVEIFQIYNGLPVGISKIDYMFLEYMNFYLPYYSVSRYQARDVQLECAKIYVQESESAAKNFARTVGK